MTTSTTSRSITTSRSRAEEAGGMDVVELARWQFAITTVYHFWSVPISIGLSAIVAGLQTTWLVTKKDDFLRAHQVLRQAPRRQLRARRRHRPRAGVPVRPELVRVLPLRRRRLRHPARARGTARVLPRVHVPRPVDLRLGPPPQGRPPRRHLDRRDRHPAQRVRHPRRELVDAAPRRVRDRRRPRQAHRLRRRAHQRHRDLGRAPYGCRVLRHRGSSGRGHLVLAPGAQERGSRTRSARARSSAPPSCSSPRLASSGPATSR